MPGFLSWLACLLMTWLVIGEQKKAEGHSFRFDIVVQLPFFGWLSCCFSSSVSEQMVVSAPFRASSSRQDVFFLRYS